MQSKLIQFVVTILFSVASVSAQANWNFTFNRTNINALIGLICVGKENIATKATGGGIENERLSVSEWKITENPGSFYVSGYCNAGLYMDGQELKLGNAYELEIEFKVPDIKNSTGDYVVEGEIGSDKVEILFHNLVDIENAAFIEKTIVRNIGIATGLFGWFSNSNMSLCNSSSRACRANRWKSSPDSRVFYRAMGAGWLMNFGVREIADDLYFNAIKIVDSRGPNRLPPFQCGKDKYCAATVALGAGSDHVYACSKYKESFSAEVTKEICENLVEKLKKSF